MPHTCILFYSQHEATHVLIKRLLVIQKTLGEWNLPFLLVTFMMTLSSY